MLNGISVNLRFFFWDTIHEAWTNSYDERDKERMKNFSAESTCNTENIGWGQVVHDEANLWEVEFC
jgi:hypothetical protein